MLRIQQKIKGKIALTFANGQFKFYEKVTKFTLKKQNLTETKKKLKHDIPFFLKKSYFLVDKFTNIFT